MKDGFSTADKHALLDRWRPYVQYDSQESFRPDSPAVFTDMRGEGGGNTLRRENGELIAVATLPPTSVPIRSST